MILFLNWTQMLNSTNLESKNHGLIEEHLRLQKMLLQNENIKEICCAFEIRNWVGWKPKWLCIDRFLEHI